MCLDHFRLVPEILSKIYSNSRDYSQANNLIEQLNFLLSQGEEHTFRHLTQIKLTYTIDENTLGRLINDLEFINTPRALFIAGLLLDGIIETVADKKDNMNSYMMKRMQDAISFYLQAGRDANLKPVLETMLWEIKALQIAPAISNRLAPIDVNPSPLCIPTSVNYSAKNKNRVYLPLENPRGRFSKPSIVELLSNASAIFQSAFRGGSKVFITNGTHQIPMEQNTQTSEPEHHISTASNKI